MVHGYFDIERNPWYVIKCKNAVHKTINNKIEFLFFKMYAFLDCKNVKKKELEVLSLKFYIGLFFAVSVISL